MKDLSHICRKVLEWKDDFDFVAVSEYGTVRWLNGSSSKSFRGNFFSREEWAKEANLITGKPRWPMFSKSLGEHSMIQTKIGNWYMIEGSVDPNCKKSMENLISNGDRIGFGEVLGDWKKTLATAIYS